MTGACVGRASNRAACRDGFRGHFPFGCQVTPHPEDADSVTGIRWGRSDDGEGGWTRWAVVPVSELASEGELAWLLGSDDLLLAAIERTGWYDFYGAPGRPYAHAPRAKRYGRKVLVVQFGGLDI